MNSSMDTQEGATVVISHHVIDEHQNAYEKWLNEIGAVCKAYPGNLGVQIIRPVTGATTTYTVIIRFDTREHLLAWMGSQDRKKLIEIVRPLLSEDDKFLVQSGFDFWFTPEGAKVRVPTRWKQFLVTWSAIYPLVLLVLLALDTAIRRLGMPENYYLKTLLGTCIVVLLMVYVIMPPYTKLLQRWLYR